MKAFILLLLINLIIVHAKKKKTQSSKSNQPSKSNNLPDHLNHDTFGAPMQGMPMQGGGMPKQGMPMQGGGMPKQGMPMQGGGMPKQGMPMRGMPMQGGGMPMQGGGMPMQGMPQRPVDPIPEKFQQGLAGNLRGEDPMYYRGDKGGGARKQTNGTGEEPRPKPSPADGLDTILTMISLTRDILGDSITEVMCTPFGRKIISDFNVMKKLNEKKASSVCLNCKVDTMIKKESEKRVIQEMKEHTVVATNGLSDDIMLHMPELEGIDDNTKKVLYQQSDEKKWENYSKYLQWVHGYICRNRDVGGDPASAEYNKN